MVIASRFPWPLEKGDKLRLYQQLSHLSANHRIHLFALNHRSVDESSLLQLKAICESVHVHVIPFWRVPINMLLGFLKGLPLSVAYFLDGRGLSKLRKLVGQVQPDLTYGQLIRCGPYLQVCPGPRVLDLMDAFSLIMKQRAAHAGWWWRPFLHMESARLTRYERRVPLWTDRQTFISQRDRKAVDPGSDWPAVIVPNGIDTTTFSPGSATSDDPPADITFVGNLGYQPNRVAVSFLVRKIMPLVWASRPETTVLLAGARPGQEIRRMAGSLVRVIPWLDDIREGYRAGSLFVAPLHLGAGLQNKILEAMAMELPVITTAHVNKAVGAHPGTEILTAESPEEFAATILHLLEHPDLTASIAGAARTFVETNFSWSSCVHLLDQSVLTNDTDPYAHPRPGTPAEHH